MTNNYSNEFKYSAFFLVISTGFILNIFSLLLSDGQPSTILLISSIIMSGVTFYSIPYFLIINQSIENRVYFYMYLSVAVVYFFVFSLICGIFVLSIIFFEYKYYSKVLAENKIELDFDISPFALIKNSDLDIKIVLYSTSLYLIIVILDRVYFG
ncbi:hypothetical protein A8B79_11265 [Balneola sp. EhC07]|jgi:hypothetical protein|nr:hypothetical protein A8B79_11265 [Balneola sp. EhC07]